MVASNSNGVSFVEGKGMYLNNALLKTSAEYRLPTKFSIIFEYEPTVNLQPWTLVRISESLCKL